MIMERRSLHSRSRPWLGNRAPSGSSPAPLHPLQRQRLAILWEQCGLWPNAQRIFAAVANLAPDLPGAVKWRTWASVRGVKVPRSGWLEIVILCTILRRSLPGGWPRRFLRPVPPPRLSRRTVCRPEGAHSMIAGLPAWLYDAPPPAPRQYKPTARDWRPYDAELRRYPWRHPPHIMWLTLQKQELELMACELDPMRGRPDIYGRIRAEEQSKRAYFLFPPPPHAAPHSPHAPPNPEAMPTPAPVAESGTGGLCGQEEGTE
jgi:hypothetical protein